MAKINIVFNNKNYSIDESSFAAASSRLQQHLSTTMSGSGATINFDGISYGIDSTKLSATTNDFISHLGTVAGSGYKVVVNGVEYGVDSTKVAGAVSELETVLGNLNNPDDVTSETYEAGLYQTGAIALYNEQGAEAIEGMMIKSWDELLAEGAVSVENGVVYTPFDTNEWVNPSSDALVGDLMLPYDGSVIKIGNAYWDDDAGNFVGHVGFTCCENLTGVLIPDGVISIGEGAFQESPNLVNIIIPDSVSSIGTEAFYFCTSLKSIKLSNPNIVIGEGAFSNCTGLTNVDIPDGITAINDYVFVCCENLTNIELPDSVISIGIGAFSGCTSLTSVSIPYGVTSLDEAFNSCTSLTSVSIPESVTSLDHTFCGCNGLTSVGSVGSGASIEIPNGVSSLNGTFMYCEGLTSVTIPNNITEINESTFDCCLNLSNITFEGTVAQWNDIELGEWWNNQVPATEVICSDGTVSLVGK